MSKYHNFDIENLAMKHAKDRFERRKIIKELWPIDWENFKTPKTVFNSLVKATYAVKAIFLISMVFMISSFSFLVYGVYTITTVPVGAEGGIIREAVVGGEMKVFNPVLDRTNNEAEKKVIDLIYFPLYEVEYPNFLNSSKAQPTIKPILLSKSPEWTDLNDPNPVNRYKELKFTLREDIKWSNGSPITVDDIRYSFERYKEDSANVEFRNLFRTLVYKKVSTNEFTLTANTGSPQLMYLANFRPISKTYYSSQDTSSMQLSAKSRRPIVTSGFFTFSTEDGGKVDNPDTEKKDLVDNPISDDNGDSYRIVVLSRNPEKNYSEDIKIDKYIIKRYDDTLYNPDYKDREDLETDARDGKVDLYTRFLGSNLNLSPEDLKDKTKLNQFISPTNTFYNAYYNISPGSTGYLVNQSLRNYITCHLLNFNPTDLSPYLDSIPQDKKVVPIQLNHSYSPNCTNPDSLLDSNYTVMYDERNNMKDVSLAGQSFRELSAAGKGITIFAYPESKQIASKLGMYFRDTIGVPVNITYDIIALNEQTYHIAVLPVTLLNRDLYPMFSSKGQDISKIYNNTRVTNDRIGKDYKVEQNLLEYSMSDMTDEESYNNLVEFFSEQYVSVNLFRAKNEYNYSNNVYELGNSILKFTTFINDVYYTMPNWYVETKRQWRWK